MPLNPSNGNMYEFVTHTWNTVKGKCFHNCSYCYMKKLNKEQHPIELDIKEFKTNLGLGNFIFVGSGIDLFAKDIPDQWIKRTLDYCYQVNVSNLFGATNNYLFQSKNPRRILDFIEHPVFKSSVICTTIETNRHYPEIMNDSSKVEERAKAMSEISQKWGIDTYVTVEPIMDFDLDEMIELIRLCHPKQVNFGKNSNKLVTLPDPTEKKVLQLIKGVKDFSTVHIKENMKKNKTRTELNNRRL